MRAVVQRVREARVEVDGEAVGRVGPGLLVLVGVARDDGPEDVRWMAAKIRELRVFDDGEGKMNRSVTDAGGGVLLVSQFTLLGDCRKGRRPSFDDAAVPLVARALYEDLARAVGEGGLAVETGVFQALMQVHSINDGPVTLLVDSRKRF